MLPSSPINLPAWLLHREGPRALNAYLTQIGESNAPIARAFAYHGLGADLRNHLRENTHGWTDKEIDRQLLPIVRRALQIHSQHLARDPPTPAPTPAAR